MARPLVLVFQDLAQPQATPTTPDLNTIVIGPAYDIFDYPDDAATILLTPTYGQLEQPAGNGGAFTGYTPPLTGTVAVTVLSNAYPGQSPGSAVDHASVEAVLKAPHVILGSTYLSSGIAPVFGGSVTTSASDQTLIQITGGPTTDFIAAGIQPGDRVIITSSQSANEQTVVATVVTVGEPNPSGLATDSSKLRISVNLPAAGTGAGQWTYDTAGQLRIERTLATQQLASSSVVFPSPGTDDLNVTGGVQISISLTPFPSVSVPSPATTTVSRSLSYTQLYLAYRALRQDLQQADSVNSASIVVSNASVGISNVNPLGKIDARNPLAVGVWIALQNSGGAPIFYYGVPTNDASGHLSARAGISTLDNLYCEVPLTQDLSVIAAYNLENVNNADPNQAATTGVLQKFRIVLGSAPLPAISTIYPGSLSGVASIPSGAATNLNRTLDIANASAIDVSQVLPGDQVVIGVVPLTDPQWQNRRGTHRVGHVNSSPGFPSSGSDSNFEIVPGSSRWADASLPAGSGDIELQIIGQTGVVKVSKLASTSITTGTGGTLGTIAYQMLVPTLVGGPYQVIYKDGGGGAALSVSLVGFVVTVTVDHTNAAHTHTAVAAAVNANAQIAALMTATVSTGGGNAVTPVNQRTNTAQDGTAASIVSGASSGNMRVTGLTGMTTASATYGHLLTISGAATAANNGTFVIVAYNSATSVDVANAAAVVPDGNNPGIVWSESVPLVPTAGSCTTTITVNDGLYNKLTDSSALFLTSGVKPGDTLQFPVDPNNYGPNAFAGQVLNYVVAQVLNENSLLIANGLDDTDAAANELPHFFDRNISNRFIVTPALPPNALNYRIQRSLTKDQQVSSLVSIAAGIRSKRTTLIWPDLAVVSGLFDGSLPRSVSTSRAPAAAMPAWVLASEVGGALAGLPPQQGLTNLGLAGIQTLVHSQGYFSEQQLSQISDGGWYVMMQRNPTDLPFCIHQLTTDITALETGELSVVKNVDFVSIFFQGICEPFLGQYNVLPETLQDIERAVNEGAANLMSRRVAKIGAPLLSGSVTTIQIADFAADRIQVFFTGSVPRPLNTIEFHLVV